MHLHFLWIGATRNPAFAAAESDYLQRIGRFLPCEVQASPERRKTDPRALASQLAREEVDLLARLRPASRLLAMDSAGRQFSSEEFAAYLGDAAASACKSLTFLVGGHYGIPPGILSRADLVLSLGRGTYPHELARVMLVEQVYRALTILRGVPYHK